MKLFLQWVLLNILFFVGLIIVSQAYSHNLHTAAKISIASILLTFVITTAYCGYNMWLYDKHSIINFKKTASHIHFGASLCPMLGLLGTVSGFLIAFSSASDQDQLNRLIEGASTALASTFIGILCGLVLSFERHLLIHRDEF